MKRNGHPCPPWLWPNLLSLDAPVVAVAWQWLFARVFGADLPAVFHLILGLSVWCIWAHIPNTLPIAPKMPSQILATGLRLPPVTCCWITWPWPWKKSSNTAFFPRR